MGVEIIAAIGTALAGVIGAFFGGKNSLHGLKARVDSRFDSVDRRFDATDRRFDRIDEKMDSFAHSDGAHEARLTILEKELARPEVALREEAS